jgi:hypothetical protein
MLYISLKELLLITITRLTQVCAVLGIYKDSPVLVFFNSSESDNHWFRFFEAKKTVRPCCFRNLKERTIFYETTHKEEAVLWAVI